MIENHKNAWVKSEPEILNDLFKTVMWDRFKRSNSNSRSQDRDRIKNLMPKKDPILKIACLKTLKVVNESIFCFSVDQIFPR